MGSVIYGNVFLTPSGGIVGPVTVTVPVGVRTLILDMSMSDAETIISVSVAGTSSGRYYYNQAPYLFQRFGATNSYQVVVPFIGLVDTQVTIQMTQAGAPDQVDFTVFGDTAQYPESAFYNGPVTVADAVVTGAGTTTLATGPCRLLTAALGAQAASNGNITVGTAVVLNVQGGGEVAVGFPPNGQIVAPGVVVGVQWGAGTILGAISTAYP